MKPWQIPLFGCLCATAFCIVWWQGLVYGAPPAPSPAPYGVSLILPDKTINCRGGADALTYSLTAIVVDCSKDRVFVNGFEL